jgi:periplasmic glucans biosynthesis protein
MITRRTLLESATATAVLAQAGFSSSALAQTGLSFGRAAPFSFEALKARAIEIAAKPYVSPPLTKPEVLEAIDYDAHGKIKYRPEAALFAEGASEYPVTFFHLGRYFQKPVRMFAVYKEVAKEITYQRSLFDMPANSPAQQLPENVGFAGFRFQESLKSRVNLKGESLDWRKNDWVAFLGASYFRAIGEMYQYGLSARGIAVDVAVHNVSEEFPSFTHIYFETPEEGDTDVHFYALLDGPSVAGAYHFTCTRDKGVSMEVEASLILRKDVNRLGLAPLTSMYWFSETQKKTAVDWRPEVHDSDGLLMWTGTGERIWRPLNNPPRTLTSAFADHSPKGFGLMQRDRVQGHYLDGVFYERRPSVWVEPTTDWGKGSVQLIEIPTDDEIHDNIVAMWVPFEAAKAGNRYDLSYKLFWHNDEPNPSPLAKCVATRLGNGGQPGQPRPQGVRKFVLEFLGEPLKNIPFGTKPEVVLWASRGTYSYTFSEALPNDVAGHWRAQFDLTAEGSDPVEMRAFLKVGDQILTETWLYQYHPMS